jgi:3'-phosphoadenosine 5'-phosphosulfate sulfotransferase (PAPS reductase)/FAD synthetase
MAGKGAGTVSRVVSWFSCGAASAVATKLTLQKYRGKREVVIAYCETGGEHPDNKRFMADCARWFNQDVVRVKNTKYASVWDLWEKRRFLSGVNGALCTSEMKVAPRMDFQLPSDTHIFGYTADAADIKRATDFRSHWDLMNVETPLIDAGLNKSNVLAMIEGAGIKLPVLYGLGFHNNNCIPCVKATSPDYWSLVRREFPEEFDRMAKLSRELNVRLTRIKDERTFIDEIPANWPCTDPIAPACDFMCQFAEMDKAA